MQTLPLSRRSVWQRLGQSINLPASDPNLLSKAGLDWEPELRPLSSIDRHGDPVTVATHRAVLRSDTGGCLGVVGQNYTISRNSRLLDAVAHISGDAVIETAGCLEGGSRVWVSARIDELGFSIGSDHHEARMNVSTRHDGTGALTVELSVLRLVCLNGLRAWKRHGAASIRHTSRVEVTLANFSQQYAYALACFHAQRDALERMASVSTITQHEGGMGSLNLIMRKAWEVTAETLIDEAPRAATIRRDRETTIRRIRSGPTCNVAGTEGTIFSDLQAITEYVDHHAKDGEAGALFAIGSTGEAIKSRAYDAALTLV